MKDGKFEAKFYRYHYIVDYNNEKVDCLISRWHHKKFTSMDNECYKEIIWNFCDKDGEDNSNLIKWSIVKIEEKVETYEMEQV